METRKGLINFPIEKSRYYGGEFRDTKFFDDIAEIGDLYQYSIHKIKFWYGSATPETLLNGIQIFYKHRLNGKIVTTGERFGTHHLQNSVEFILEENEYIKSATIWSTAYIGRIEFWTNKNKLIAAGGYIYDRQYHWVRSETRYSIDMTDKIMVGTFGGYGANLNGFGIYLAPKMNYLNRFKEFLLLVRMKLKKEKRFMLNEIATKFNSQGMKECKIKNAFGFLCTLPTHVFACVVSYV
jgi:hypothetical protein